MWRKRISELLENNCVGMDDHGPGIGVLECVKCKDMFSKIVEIVEEEIAEAECEASESAYRNATE